MLKTGLKSVITTTVQIFVTHLLTYQLIAPNDFWVVMIPRNDGGGGTFGLLHQYIRYWLKSTI